MSKTEKQLKYEEALSFRLKFSESLMEIEDHFRNPYIKQTIAQPMLDAISDLVEAWSNVIKDYLIECDVEEGIVGNYHPAIRLPETMRNHQEKLNKRLEEMEAEIKRVKNASN